MLDNFGNFASWTEWSLAFNLFFEWRPDPADASKKIQARCSLASHVLSRAASDRVGRNKACDGLVRHRGCAGMQNIRSRLIWSVVAAWLEPPPA